MYPVSYINTSKRVPRQYLNEAFAEPVLRSFFGKHIILWILLVFPILWLAVSRPLSHLWQVNDVLFYAYLSSTPMLIVEAVLAFVLLYLTVKTARELRGRLLSVIENGGVLYAPDAKERFHSDDMAYKIIPYTIILMILANFFSLLSVPGSEGLGIANIYVFVYGSYSVKLYGHSPIFAEDRYIINRWTIAYSAIAKIEIPESEIRRKGKNRESRGIWLYNAEGKLIGRDRFYTADAEYLKVKITSPLNSNVREVTR
jgi:hypothetical protein